MHNRTLVALLILTLIALIPVTLTDAQNRGITASAWSDDGQMLAVGISDQIRIYRNGKIDPLIIHHPHTVQELTFNANGTLLASTDDGLTVQVWDTQTGTATASRAFGSYGRVEQLHFFPDQDVLYLLFFAGYTNGSPPLPAGIWLWEYNSTAEPRVIPTSEYFPERLLSINLDHSLVVTTQRDSQLGSGLPIARLMVRNLASGEIIHQLVEVRPVFSELIFSPVDPDMLCSIDVAGVVRFWNVRDGVETFALTLPYDLVTTAAFSRDGRLLATAGTDGKVRLWRVHDGALLEVYDQQRTEIQRLHFTVDGTLSAFSDPILSAEVWNVRTGETIISFHIDKVPPLNMEVGVIDKWIGL